MKKSIKCLTLLIGEPLLYVMVRLPLLVKPFSYTVSYRSTVPVYYSPNHNLKFSNLIKYFSLNELVSLWVNVKQPARMK